MQKKHCRIITNISHSPNGYQKLYITHFISPNKDCWKNMYDAGLYVK